MSSKKIVDLLKQILQISRTTTGFAQNLKHVSHEHILNFERWLDKSIQLEIHVSKIEITGGDVGRCVAEFTVRKENLNEGGGLHGGFTATIVDNFTTYALLTKEGCNPGVTVDLHVS